MIQEPNKKTVILRPKAEGSLRFFALLRMTFILLSIFFVFNPTIWAEDPNVQIQKTEDRTGAVVTASAPAKKRPDNNPVDRFFAVIETGVMGVAVPVSYCGGKLADIVTLGVEKASSPVFSRFFRTVDLKKKFESKENKTS